MSDDARLHRLRPSRAVLSRFVRPVSVGLAIGLAVAVVGAQPAGAAGVSWAPVAPAVPVPSAPSLPVVAPITTGLNAFDSQVFGALNAQRSAAGLSALVEVKGIDTESMNWSQTMASAGQLSHNGQAFTQLLTSGAPNRTAFGENVASWNDTSVNGTALVAKYLTNPTNSANVLSATYKYVGIGTATATDGSKWSTATFVDSADPAQTYDPALQSIPVGQFNSATLVGSTVQVSGWGYDPDTATSPIQVKLTDTPPSGTVVSSTVTAGTTRTDVTQLTATTGTAHGFAATLPISGRGVHQICATLINAGPGSTNPALGCLPVEVKGPYGSLDTADVSGTTAAVTGWAIDPDAPSSAATVTVTDQNAQGTTTTTVTADQANANVDASIPGVGANHGFSKQISVTSVGKHTICATVASLSDATLTKNLGCKSITVTAPPVAAFTSTVTGLKVSFDGTGSTDAQGPISGYAWDFGDNSSGSGATASHTYAASGTYTVELTVTNSVGLTTDLARSVVVKALPSAGGISGVTSTSSSLTVGGWALDPNATDRSATVQVKVTSPSGKAVSVPTVTADDTSSDSVAQFPSAGSNHGFSVTVPTTEFGAYQVCAVVNSVVDASASTNLPCQTATITNLQGWLDKATVVNGSIKVVGWGVDPDHLTTSLAGTLTISGPSGTKTQAISADQSRTDIGNAYPGAGNLHGISVTIPSAGVGANKVCVAVQAVGNSTTRSFPCITVTVAAPAGGITGVSSMSSSLTVEGWALDPNVTGQSSTVQVKVTSPSGTVISPAVASADGASAGSVAQFPSAGSNHGFSVTVPTTEFGAYQVCAVVNSVVDASASTNLPCQTATITNLQGWLDKATVVNGSIKVVGWGVDPDHLTTSLAGTLTISGPSGTKTQAISADQSRTDIGNAYPGAGNLHGISVTIPSAGVGANKVCVAVQAVGNSTTRSFPCITVNVPGS